MSISAICSAGVGQEHQGPALRSISRAMRSSMVISRPSMPRDSLPHMDMVARWVSPRPGCMDLWRS